MIGVRFVADAGYSLFITSWDGLWSPPILYPVGIVGLFLIRQKQSQQVAPLSSKVKNTTLTAILKVYRFLYIDLFNVALKLHSYASLKKNYSEWGPHYSTH